jgi:1-pyrroline-5-carboxylate dehydrogenase
MPWEARAAIFLKASELLAGKYRAQINASTMLNQSKTCHQAEIDSACELIDFWRFNTVYAREIYEDMQPPVSPSSMWNSSEVRPLEGFVFSVTPFNFSSIAANLPSSMAIMGNTGVWKPSRNSYVSNYLLMRLMMDAGLPAGVINFIPGKASMVGDTVLAQPRSSARCGEMLPIIWRTIDRTLVWLEKQVERTSLLHIQIAMRLH